MREFIEIICVSCPVGCLMTVNGDASAVSGNQCPAGIEYAREEMSNPTRNIATSVRVSGGDMPMLSVKTKSPIPKGAIMDAVKAIHQMHVAAPVTIGDVIVADVVGTGVGIVATRNVVEVGGKYESSV